MDEISNFFSDEQWASILAIGLNVLKAVGILLLGWVIANWAKHTVHKRLGNDKGLQLNDTLRPLLASFVKYTIMFATLYAALQTAGIQAASLLAVLGAAGLAIAMAIQGTLANIAAGIMLIVLRILKVGEYIETPSFSGSVLEIGLFTTQLKTSNGVLMTIPNAQIWSGRVSNYSRASERRIDINIELSRDNDLDKALDILKTTLLKSPHIIKKDAASVALSSIGTHSAVLQVRGWIGADDVRGHSSDIQLTLHKALRANKFKLPPVFSK